MRMQTRVLWFGAGAFVGFFALLELLDRTGLSLAWMFLWVPILSLGQYWWFRCPHCRRFAILRPWGFFSPFVGYKCAYCHKPY
jgi:hypothetical protein